MTVSSEKLIAHAKSRTQTVADKVREAMRAIELDVEKNDGIYPFNRGRLTQAEVCRRAGIHKITLQGKAHKTTTREAIDAWIKRIRKRLFTGRKAVRKAVTERADDWKSRYFAVARWIDHYHLEEIARHEEHSKALLRIEVLEAENIKLRFEFSKGKVVSLRPNQRPDDGSAQV